MTGWTDADVRLVARALAAEDANWGYDCGFWVSDTDIDPETAAFARAALSALAAAGRLLPPGAKATGRCGDESPTVLPGATPVHCALPAGHAGWHRSDNGTEWTRRTDVAARSAEEGRTDDR